MLLRLKRLHGITKDSDMPALFIMSTWGCLLCARFPDGLTRIQPLAFTVSARISVSIGLCCSNETGWLPNTKRLGLKCKVEVPAWSGLGETLFLGTHC